MQNFKIVIVQADIAWEDIDENLFNFDNKLKQIDGAPDLIVLPEMFNTGFTMNVEKCAENEPQQPTSQLIAVNPAGYKNYFCLFNLFLRPAIPQQST